jgi:outer membrane protein assembly factor BamA
MTSPFFPTVFRIIFFSGILVFFLWSGESKAQTNRIDTLTGTTEILHIRKISVEGNHQTKTPIILRELLFHEKDTLLKEDFSALLKASHDNIFNTRLFNFVTIDTLCFPGEIIQTEVVIRVVERWYFWPIPYLEISDRNFNAWLQTLDFSRLTYGIDLTLNNVRGRNETLMFPIHFGFNREFGITYYIPFVNSKKTFGLAFGVQFDQNHELIIKSLKNRPVYFKDPDHFIRQNIYSFIESRLRLNHYIYHILRIEYNAYSFSDSLCRIPGYTSYNKPYLNFFTLTYQLKNDHRDIARDA